MLTLIDTSLWVDFTRTRSPQTLKRFIAPFILHPDAHLAEPIAFEILRHATPVEAKQLTQQFQTLPLLATPPQLWTQAADLGQTCRQKGITVNALDLLIAAVAVHHGAEVITFEDAAEFQKWRRDMSTKAPRFLQKMTYEREATKYLLGLPLEHFMESTSQATQREITLASLALVKARRADVHVFNELLVQYPVRGEERTGKVVPDNMVVICSEPLEAESSYNVPLEPAKPFWVMEYVSAGNKRKDYEDSFYKYEMRLKVPYYLIFHPEIGELTLYKHNQRTYATVRANNRGRLAVKELEIEVALLDGWVRFWYQGELLPLPAEMQNELDEARRQQADEKRRADEEKRRADELQHQLAAAERELAEFRRRSENGRSKGETPS